MVKTIASAFPFGIPDGVADPGSGAGQDAVFPSPLCGGGWRTDVSRERAVLVHDGPSPALLRRPPSPAEGERASSAFSLCS